MEYTPQEGIDYITDYYSLIGADSQSDPDVIKHLLNDRTKEYHPDRLQGMAPEFQAKGQRMAELLNRARGILLNPDNRAEYDSIMSEWTGPISPDGTPILTIEAQAKAIAASQSPEELEANFQATREKIIGMTGYKPSRLSLLERMIAEAGDNIPEDLCDEYEDALLEADRVLAIDEAERLAVLGIDRYQAGYDAVLDYGNVVAGEIEVARAQEQQKQFMIEIGRVPTRLALMSGEITSQSDEAENKTLPARPEDVVLPEYFDQQADKVRLIAKEREDILERRLANFRIDYPGNQTEGFESVYVGVDDSNEGHIWLYVKYDSENDTYNGTTIDESIQSLLDKGDYEKVINLGNNVITFKPLEQIEIKTLFDEAISLHFSRLRSKKWEIIL